MQFRYLNEGGYSEQPEDARKAGLKKDDILVLDRMVVSQCHTNLFFIEYPNRGFNSVMFELVKPENLERYHLMVQENFNLRYRGI
jgi:hypothetical protein